MSSERLFGIIIGIPVFICWYVLFRVTRHPYISWLICTNLAGFFIMAIDKKQSVKDKYRVPNKIILATSLLGGPLGVFSGTLSFHHKSLMPRFKLLIGAILAVHILFFLLIMKIKFGL
ncbi:MAG: DUF1294 domain-containing protein [Candidatus Latescibacteria bacterium]|jgi:uncharacterized membrane protein YsdA (DUF1294 family)|nr:DUF1294 domain-containing protein [Candidatus Latescibacterota bacterium]